MDKLNDWTKSVFAWAKDRPADAILMATTMVVCWKIGVRIGEAIVEKL